MPTTNVSAVTPFTLITGFLGAGKTSLLNRILSGDHGQKLAVIVNEFGEINVESDTIAATTGDGIIEMNNGCVCCTVQEDLLGGLLSLLQQHHDGTLGFTHIVMETTGLARPGPIIQTLAHPSLNPTIALNSIVTLVDAFHGPTQLDDFEEAQAQVGMADHILLNKTDLVEEEHLADFCARLRGINGIAAIVPCKEADVDVAEVLARRSTLPPSLYTEQASSNGHHHLDRVATFIVRVDAPLDHALLQDWFSYLTMRYTERLMRYKGILNLAGRSTRVVLQGVHSLIETHSDRSWGSNEHRETKIVFIGTDLPEQEIRQGLKECIATT